MPRLIATRGLPASGKTTYALNWVKEDPDSRVRVNRDDLRAMAGIPYSPANEFRVILQRNALITQALKAGYDVINDDTNLPQRTVRDLAKLAKAAGAEFEVTDFTHVQPDVCEARNTKRKSFGERGVPDEVIWNMWTKYLDGRPCPLPLPAEPENSTEFKPYFPDTSKPKAVIFDVDGTLAEMCDRSPYEYAKVSGDLPIGSVIDEVHNHLAAGYRIIFLSGRKDSCSEETVGWLKRHTGITYPALLMRSSDDNRKDSIVKYELFDKYVRSNYNVRCVYDDRNQVVDMWRDLGIQTFQVNYGDF